jgi:hypothetical protein
MKRTFLDKPGLLAFVLVAMLLPLRAQETRPLRLEVDAREAARNVVHSRLTIPIRSGPVTLSFPT